MTKTKFTVGAKTYEILGYDKKKKMHKIRLVHVETKLPWPGLDKVQEPFYCDIDKLQNHIQLT